MNPFMHKAPAKPSEKQYFQDLRKNALYAGSFVVFTIIAPYVMPVISKLQK